MFAELDFNLNIYIYIYIYNYYNVYMLLLFYCCIEDKVSRGPSDKMFITIAPLIIIGLLEGRCTDLCTGRVPHLGLHPNLQSDVPQEM